MFVVNFRIPYKIPAIPNQKFYINGSAFSFSTVNKGAAITVNLKEDKSLKVHKAEVVERNHTKRLPKDFKWEIL